MSSYQAIFTVLRDYNEKLLQEACPPPISRKYKNAYKDWPFFDIRPHGACTVDGHHQGNETSKSKIDLEISLSYVAEGDVVEEASLCDSDNRFRGIVEAMPPVPFKHRKLRPRGRDDSPKKREKPVNCIDEQRRSKSQRTEDEKSVDSEETLTSPPSTASDAENTFSFDADNIVGTVLRVRAEELPKLYRDTTKNQVNGGKELSSARHTTTKEII